MDVTQVVGALVDAVTRHGQRVTVFTVEKAGPGPVVGVHTFQNRGELGAGEVQPAQYLRPRQVVVGLLGGPLFVVKESDGRVVLAGDSQDRWSEVVESIGHVGGVLEGGPCGGAGPAAENRVRTVS